MSYELPALAAISAGYLVSYFAGVRRKRQLMMKYSRTISDEMSRIGKVGFRPFGHAGVRIRCDVKDADHDYKSIELALSMADRENLLYYPLSVLRREGDSLAFWGFPTKPVKYSLEIIPPREVKTIRKIENERRLWKMAPSQASIAGSFDVYTDDTRMAEGLMSAERFYEDFSKLARFIKRFSIDSSRSAIHFRSDLREDNLPGLLGFVKNVGQVFNRTLT